ncbi:MAG: hypothetical protein RIT34_1870 [Bacteroidota bacterium]|jgi:hypothetical protein
MKPNNSAVETILENIPEERKEAFERLHQIIVDHLPAGLEPGLSYGNLGYVVPHSLYPAGYHCKPSEPLPLAWIASQKNSINFYHMGIYADPKLMDWFLAEYPKHSTQKLDMGKSCMRFKKPEQIPFELLGQLMGKMTAAQWIDMYESLYKK